MGFPLKPAPPCTDKAGPAKWCSKVEGIPIHDHPMSSIVMAWHCHSFHRDSKFCAKLDLLGSRPTGCARRHSSAQSFHRGLLGKMGRKEERKKKKQSFRWTIGGEKHGFLPLPSRSCLYYLVFNVVLVLLLFPVLRDFVVTLELMVHGRVHWQGMVLFGS